MPSGARTLHRGPALWTSARAAGCPPDLYAVSFTHRRHHAFEQKPEGRKRCAECDGPKLWPGHHGYPPSMNVAGSGANRHAYQATKHLWQSILTPLIERAGLPRGLGRVEAEGTICFPTRARRDQGNFRIYLEKALGDALVEGGWLADDSWEHFEFGALRMAHSRGAAWTAVTLVPSWDAGPAAEALPAPDPPGQLGIWGGGGAAETLLSLAVSRPKEVEE